MSKTIDDLIIANLIQEEQFAIEYHDEFAQETVELYAKGMQNFVRAFFKAVHNRDITFEKK